MDIITQNTYEVLELVEAGQISAEEVDYLISEGTIDPYLFESVLDEMIAESEYLYEAKKVNTKELGKSAVKGAVAGAAVGTALGGAELFRRSHNKYLHDRDFADKVYYGDTNDKASIARQMSRMDDEAKGHMQKMMMHKHLQDRALANGNMDAYNHHGSEAFKAHQDYADHFEKTHGGVLGSLHKKIDDLRTDIVNSNLYNKVHADWENAKGHIGNAYESSKEALKGAGHSIKQALHDHPGYAGAAALAAGTAGAGYAAYKYLKNKKAKAGK